jgi:hypothetical protein
MAQPKLPTGQQVKWEAVPFPSVYANIMQLGLTSFDISFTFGEIGSATASEVQAVPKVKVILSPEQALNLSKLITASLETYTRHNGALRAGGALNIEEVNKQLGDLAAADAKNESR